MKKWTVTIEEDDEGHIRMNRENDGFDVFELIAFTEIQRADLLDMLRGNTKIDEIKRTATDRSPGV